MGLKANSIKSPAVQKKFSKRNKHLTTFPSILQGLFFEMNSSGKFIFWLRSMNSAGGYRVWRPWIDPSTGKQMYHYNLGVWFQFNKTHLDRQKVKGQRSAGLHSDTTGVVLSKGHKKKRPNWPASMGSARDKRGAVAEAPKSPNTTSWGHQLAFQWGGKF